MRRRAGRAPSRAAPKSLGAVRGFVFDVDGTLALTGGEQRGHRALPGACELLSKLRDHGLPYAAFTNGTAHTPREVAASLRRAGLDLRDEELITPASVAAELYTQKRLRRILVLGGHGVAQPLLEAGLEVVHSPLRADDADAVLIGWHPQFSMKDLESACHAVWAGAPLYAVSDAPFFATAEGRSLGVSAAIAAAVHGITRKKAKVIGKPSAHGLRIAGRHLGVRPADMAVVGDDPMLEMAMAHAAGALAVAVQTGLADTAALAALPAKLKPHLVLRTVAELIELYPWHR